MNILCILVSEDTAPSPIEIEIKGVLMHPSWFWELTSGLSKDSLPIHFKPMLALKGIKIVCLCSLLERFDLIVILGSLCCLETKPEL